MYKNILVLILCLNIYSNTHADVVIGNMPPVNSTFNSQFGPEAGNRRHAISFTMPDSTYIVDSVVLDIGCINCPLDVFVTIHGDNVNEPDEIPQATFETETISSSGITVFMMNNPLIFQPLTKYWLVID